MKQYAVADIGGTNTRLAIYDENMNKLHHVRFNTEINDYKITLQKIADFLKDFKVEGLGMAIPGPANYSTGDMFLLPNMPGWRHINVIDELKKLIDIKVIKTENDANLMALAQHHYFKRGVNDITQFFTVSTGLGAGLVVNNKIFTGTNGQAQEVAQMPVAWVKEKTDFFGYGALEHFASGSGLLKRSTQFGIKSTAELFDAYKANKDFAVQVINDGVEALANAIAVVAGIINPSAIVFDGSVARNNKWYIDKAIELSKDRMFPSQWDAIEFKMSELDDDAALIGAFHLISK